MQFFSIGNNYFSRQPIKASETNGIFIYSYNIKAVNFIESEFYFYKGNLFLNHDLPHINITFYMTVSCPRTALKIFIFKNPCLHCLYFLILCQSFKTR